ncbi:MBL fold metallo-hydrolase [Usitatibacter palustris]|uniref:Hydroxyacylglutathione hydrolase n=1 Tax=Usitatibacter palustris TaxID=2732487 RepID=A0A6M4H872_9PROT|nr:MBL fold metallo-hydrolase [Usitatibacter palustris]QJR15562.1 Hydroxyacylglutathione hydrolase [Usitatibacter palustris]
MIVVDYPFAEALPAPGEAIRVAEGVHWIRMPLPFALDHINLWLLEDGDGWTIVDTGLGVQATWDLWEKQFAGTMGGRPVKNIVVTHYHPDHLGSANWLVEKTCAPFWITLGEYLSGHAAHDDTAGFDRGTGIEFFRVNGLDTSRFPEKMRTANGYRRGVPSIPTSYRRMMHGDKLAIGGREWEVITVFGHAPEHAALYCASLNVLISGDQVLPRITTNVGVWGNQPESNPLALFLDSIGRFLPLPADARVLPSHDRVFHGLHERIAQLREHHAERLEKLAAACATPITAHEALPVLFKRTLDDHQLMFAMGEAIAHLHYLEQRGEVRRQVQADGIRRFVR